MKFTIKINISEQEFMEHLLNMRFSGLDVMIPLSFYALASSWHYKKLTYYVNLLEIAKE